MSCALALAGCGGSIGSSVPSAVGPQQGLDAATRTTDGSQSGHERLYVGEADRVLVFPLHATGNAAPLHTLTGVNAYSGTGAQAVNIAVRQHGGLTVAVMEGRSASYDLEFYPPDADGAVTPGRAVRGIPGVPLSLIEQDDGTAEFAGIGDLDTFGHDANGTGLAPKRALSLHWALELAVDAQYNIYASSRYADASGGIDVYAPHASGNAVPTRSIRFAGMPPSATSEPGELAIAPDGTIYVMAPRVNDPSTGTLLSIYAFAPGAAGTVAPSRTIDLPKWVGGAIAVDKLGEIIVNAGSGVWVYDRAASNGASPIRTLSMPDGGFSRGWVYSLAVGP